MPLINGSSSYADVSKEYGDTAPPFDTAEQCRRFIRAASILLSFPDESSGPSGGTRYNRNHIAKQLEDAQAVLPTLPGGVATQASPVRRVTTVSFRNMTR